MVNTSSRWQRWMNDGGCQNPPGRPDRVLFLKMVILFHPPGEWLCMLLYPTHCIQTCVRWLLRQSFVTVVASVFRWIGSACCSDPDQHGQGKAIPNSDWNHRCLHQLVIKENALILTARQFLSCPKSVV